MAASRGGVTSGEVDSPRDVIRGLRRLFHGHSPWSRNAARRRPAPQPVPRPERAPDEIVARGLTDDQTAALVHRATWFSNARSRQPRHHRPSFSGARGHNARRARDTIRALPGAEAADFNHYYRAGQDSAAVTPTAATAPACDGLHCPARALIGWPRALGPGDAVRR